MQGLLGHGLACTVDTGACLDHVSPGPPTATQEQGSGLSRAVPGGDGGTPAWRWVGASSTTQLTPNAGQPPPRDPADHCISALVTPALPVCPGGTRGSPRGWHKTALDTPCLGGLLCQESESRDGDGVDRAPGNLPGPVLLQDPESPPPSPPLQGAGGPCCGICEGRESGQRSARAPEGSLGGIKVQRTSRPASLQASAATPGEAWESRERPQRAVVTEHGPRAPGQPEHREPRGCPQACPSKWPDNRKSDRELASEKAQVPSNVPLVEM